MTQIESAFGYKKISVNTKDIKILKFLKNNNYLDVTSDKNINLDSPDIFHQGILKISDLIIPYSERFIESNFTAHGIISKKGNLLNHNFSKTREMFCNDLNIFDDKTVDILVRNNKAECINKDPVIGLMEKNYKNFDNEGDVTSNDKNITVYQSKTCKNIIKTQLQRFNFDDEEYIKVNTEWNGELLTKIC